MTEAFADWAPALALEGIWRSFPQGQGRLEVLRGVSLTVRRGEIVALVGPSGAGKSTLLHIAGLLERPNDGEVLINGRPCGRMSDAMRTALRRRRIGFIYQFHHLLREFSALENVALPQLIAGKSRRAAMERARILLDVVGLSDRVRHRPARLSGGEQQRVAVARALANRPLTLLADEPTGNLDPQTADQVFAELLNLVRRGGLAALVATHNLELARQMDRVVALEAGQVVDITDSTTPRETAGFRDLGPVPSTIEASAPAGGDDAGPSQEPPTASEATSRLAGHPARKAGGDTVATEDATVDVGGSQPAWRRVPALRQDPGAPDEAESETTVSPEAEDRTESLLDILYAVQRKDRPRRPPAETRRVGADAVEGSDDAAGAPARPTADYDAGEVSSVRAAADASNNGEDGGEAPTGDGSDAERPRVADAAPDTELVLPRFIGRTKRRRDGTGKP
jgi:lipoprotein-releasing system ATP-binding protein